MCLRSYLYSPFLLKNAPVELASTAPPTINIDFGGGKGNRTPTPWVAYMNPDETNSARHGIYVVYLLSADKENLVLILGQGVSELSDKYGAREARSRLIGESTVLRERLPEDLMKRFSDPVDLRSTGSLQRSYVAGAVCCRLYKTAELPSDKEMQRDLDTFLDLYESAIEIKQRLLQAEPGVMETSSWTKTNEVPNLLIGFKPKNSEDYRSVLVGKVLVKSRSHEKLVKNFGEACQAKGYEPFTPHPVDLVLRLLSEMILVEAKVVYKGNATSAVRGVVGQLLDYRYHLYPPPQEVKLLGLFSESIGDDFVEFLASLSIGVVWWSHEGWQCSSLAEEWGIKALVVKELGTRNGGVLRSTVGSNDEIPFKGSARPMNATDVVALPSGITIQFSGHSILLDGVRSNERNSEANAIDRSTRA